jgi:hypothetical protein
MSTVLLWLRNDLRLHDQPVLHAACRMGAQYILPVLCLPDIQARTHWGFARIGQHRRAWLAKTIQNLAQSFHELRSQLLILNAPAAGPPALAQALGPAIVCEDIAAPDEQAEFKLCEPQACRCTPCGTAACCIRTNCLGRCGSCQTYSHRFARLLSTPSYNLTRLCQYRRLCPEFRRIYPASTVKSRY